MPEIDNLAIDRIEHLVERAAFHEKRGNDSLKEFFLTEAKILAMVMDGADDMIKMTYHRYKSESYSIAFELEHGDEELMFGGV